MERDTYNLMDQDCAETLSGPVTKKIKTEFLGDNIYTIKLRLEDNCEENNTYVDCKGNVKYTLPLDSYRELKNFRRKI
jgi:hypothetical protein